jgi:hypothetical protein
MGLRPGTRLDMAHQVAAELPGVRLVNPDKVRETDWRNTALRNGVLFLATLDSAAAN